MSEHIVEEKENTKEEDEMFSRAGLLTQLVASSVRVSERAGQIIKDIMSGGDLKIINKGIDGKEDLQTEADRCAQYCIIRSLQKKFGPKLKIIGEEEHTTVCEAVELSTDPSVLKEDSKLTTELRNINLADLVVWVDPLDGTSDFANAAKNNSPALEQVTVLIGIAHKGISVAGVIHQPYYQQGRGRTVWAINDIGTFGIDLAKAIPKGDEKIIVTTRSHSSKLVTEAIQALREKKLVDTVVTVGGAGYKVLRCLEGASAYVFASAGCKKWDTAAPEAVITAAGGKLTDISGRRIMYHEDVQLMNSGGVLATAPTVDHRAYVEGVPESVRSMLPEQSKI